MLTVIGLTSTAFGVSIAGALVPLISVEFFVIGFVLSGPELPWWLLALVIAVGQMGGKLLYYYAARGTIRVPALLRRKDESSRQGRWGAVLYRFKVGCQRHPTRSGLFLLVSAISSLPPFAATSAVAGWARISLPIFLITAFTGRFIRFAGLAAAPTLLIAWL